MSLLCHICHSPDFYHLNHKLNEEYKCNYNYYYYYYYFRFKIFSNQSALESLAVSVVSFCVLLHLIKLWHWVDRGMSVCLSVPQLIPLQAPLKTMLQMSVVPLINSKNLINCKTLKTINTEFTVTHCDTDYCEAVLLTIFCFCVFRLDKERSSDSPGWWNGLHWGGGWISQCKSMYSLNIFCTC